MFVEHWDELNLLEMSSRWAHRRPWAAALREMRDAPRRPYRRPHRGAEHQGVVYGTDAFCALVQRPTLARVDDATLTAVMGNVHRFGDRRLPVPGVLGIIASTAACVFAALAGLARRISVPLRVSAAQRHEAVDLNQGEPCRQ
jgi:hypothetical protein